ncbi:ATP-binding protein [Candidatus Azambacteria bacterium]|nr:ATP-binding protein [Candidatus Azambacteria bacterium]
MKKKIVATDGEYVVETEGELWGFRSGDVITDDQQNPSSSRWHAERVRVEGFENNKLWGTVIGKSNSLHATNSDNLILLERPGLKFKVGDRVRAVASEPKGKTGTVVVLNPSDTLTSQIFLAEFEDFRDGHDGDGTSGANTWAKPWYPQSCKTESNARWWCAMDDLELIGGVQTAGVNPEASAISQEPEKPIASTKEEVIAVNDEMPEWLKELVLRYQAGVAHLFILWGNVYDLQRSQKGTHLSLYQYLAEVFEQRMVLFYSISAGVQFADAEKEKQFRQQYCGAGVPAAASQTAQTSAVQKAAQGFQQSMMTAPLDQLTGGKTPDKMLPLLEQVLTDDTGKDGSLKKALVIDFAHNIAPAFSSGLAAGERAQIETLERWARDKRIKEAGNTVILVTPHLADVAESIRSAQSGAVAIRISKPKDTERTLRWHTLIEGNGVSLDQGLDAESLGRITGGLSLRQIDGVYALAKARNTTLDLSLVKRRKQEALEAEFGERIKVKTPQFGFRYFGGKENVKAYLHEVRDYLLKGMTRRVPMGMLAAGPPGTGKTFLFECWAYECGFNFVEIANPRTMWVGESERTMAAMLAALDDLAPVIVVEDEADQSESPRDVPNGDSGVSNRLRQMKFQFCSDPKRRGKVVWVRISNRDDLIDAAYKRKGRTDDNIPFVLPSEEELRSIFEVMFKRYEIPTDIADFSPYAKSAAEKVYCTGADIEWMVLEADKYAGREGAEQVKKAHLLQALDDWEGNSHAEIDRQIILAIKGSSKRLRPPHWRDILSAAETRLRGSVPNQPAVFPDLQFAHKTPKHEA